MKPDITANHHRPQPTAGQSLVEFALVLPVLLLLVLGAMDFARMFSTKITLTNAAREGANYLSRHPDDAPGFTNTVKAINAEKDSLNLDNVAIFCPQDTDGCLQGSTVTVTLTRSVDLIFGGFLSTFGVTDGPIQLSSTVEMLVQ
jgi:Flp pilus assembly protein TadG